MRVVVASPAQQELREAIDFYDELSPGLGYELLDAFDSAIAQIADLPESGTSYKHGTRRVLLQRFPFGVIYRIRRESAEVVALAHQRRKPNYWADR